MQLSLKGLGEYLDCLDAVHIEDIGSNEAGAAFDNTYRFLNAKGFSLSMQLTSIIDTTNAFFKRRESSPVKAVKNAISVLEPVLMSRQP